MGLAWRPALGAAAAVAAAVAAAALPPAAAVGLRAPPTPLPTPWNIFTPDVAQYVRLPLRGDGPEEPPRVAVNGPQVVDDGSGAFVSPLGCGGGGVGTAGCAYRSLTVATVGANGSVLTNQTVLTHGRGGLLFQERADFSFGRSMAVINGHLTVTAGTDPSDDPAPALLTLRLKGDDTVASTSRLDLRPVLCPNDDGGDGGAPSCAPARMTDFYVRAVGDVDGDGVEDALVYMFRTIHVVFLAADGAGITGWKSTFLPELFGLFYGRFSATNVAVLPDIDRDGVFEVAVQGVATPSTGAVEPRAGPPQVVPTRVWVLYLNTSGAVARRSASPFGFNAGGFTGTPSAPFDADDFNVGASDVATFGSLLVALPRLRDGRTLLAAASEPRSTVWVVSVGGDGTARATDTLPASAPRLPAAERVRGVFPLGALSAGDPFQRLLVTTDEGLASQRWLFGLDVLAAPDAAAVPAAAGAPTGAPTPSPTPARTPEVAVNPPVTIIAVPVTTVEAPVVAPEPPVTVPVAPVDATPDPPVESTEPPVDASEPPVDASEPPAVDGHGGDTDGDDDDGGAVVGGTDERQPGGAAPVDASASPADDADDDDSVCFPADATVELADGRTVAMADVALGDRVRVSAGAYSPVFLFTHRLRGGRRAFVRLTTAAGASVTATRGHYVYANGRLTAAGAVRVGDRMEVVGAGAATCTVVTATARVVGTGLYSPQVRVSTVSRGVCACLTSARAWLVFAWWACGAAGANHRGQAVILTGAPLDTGPSAPLRSARVCDVALSCTPAPPSAHRHCTGTLWSMASVRAPTPWPSSRRSRRRCWRPSVRSSAWRASPRRRSTGVPTAWPPSCQAALLSTSVGAPS